MNKKKEEIAAPTARNGDVVQLDDVKGLKKVKEWIKVKNWDHTREVGGVILGKFHDDGEWSIELFKQIKSAAKNPGDDYQLPNVFIVFFHIFPYLWKGYQPIGEFHGHLSGNQGLSKKDHAAIDKRLEKADFWVVAILAWKKKAKVYVFNRNKGTNVKRKN